MSDVLTKTNVSVEFMDVQCAYAFLVSLETVLSMIISMSVSPVLIRDIHAVCKDSKSS